MDKGKDAVIYGRFPAERQVGGVTTFFFNLASKYGCGNLLFVDLYSAKNKTIPHDCDSQVVAYPKPFNYFVLLLSWFRHDTVHFFNFSSVAACVLFIFLPKVGRRRIVCIFHHGDQFAVQDTWTKFQKKIITFGLNRVDKIGYLSERQRLFFQSHRIESLVKVSPYIDMPSSAPSPIAKSKQRKIVMSGFALRLYQFCEVIDVLSEVRDVNSDFSLEIFIYGETNTPSALNILAEIELKASRLDWVTLRSHCEREEFLCELRSAMLYLRVTTEDSFGLVVAEALSMGVTVIASDVCERYKGAHLIGPRDYSKLRTAVLALLCEDTERIGLERSSGSIGVADIDEMWSGEGCV